MQPSMFTISALSFLMNSYPFLYLLHFLKHQFYELALLWTLQNSYWTSTRLKMKTRHAFQLLRNSKPIFLSRIGLSEMMSYSALVVKFMFLILTISACRFSAFIMIINSQNILVKIRH